MKITKVLWDYINNGTYEAIISTLVYAELIRCSEPKRSYMLDKIKETEIKEVEIDTEISNLAD